MIKNSDYDIEKAFAAIENELLDSMMRNMKRHRAEENELGFEWSQWQAEQLKALETFKRKNKKKFNRRYSGINGKMQMAILSAKQEGNMAEEVRILDAIMKGAEFRRMSDKLAGEFFRLNSRKMDALLKAVTSDMQKAEQAILRMHDDKVRKAIFNAQIYANSGAGTYEKAVDMAVRDYASSGLNCVRYKDGRQVNIKDYAAMALRTAGKRAYLMGEGEKRAEWGIHTVIMNKRGNACPLCLPWVGRVLIDDVWSGGTVEESEHGGYPLLSKAIAAGLYHPNCRDSHSTYFPGISTPPDSKWTREELREIKKGTKQETRRNYAVNMVEKLERMEKCSIDPEDKRKYAARAEKWKERVAEATTVNTGREVYFDESKTYRIKLDSLSDKVNDSLSKAAKSVAEHGSRNGYEYLHLVDLDSGEIGDLITDHERASVGGQSFWDYIKANKDRRFAFVHNHNTDSFLSVGDMTTVLSTDNIPIMVAVRNDGIIYAVEREGSPLTIGYYDELYPEQMKSLNQKVKDGIITPLERTRQREILLVENLTKDYMKGGKMHEFGR